MLTLASRREFRLWLKSHASHPNRRGVGGSLNETEKTEALFHSSKTSKDLLSARCRDGSEPRWGPAPPDAVSGLRQVLLLTAHRPGLQENKKPKSDSKA